LWQWRIILVFDLRFAFDDFKANFARAKTSHRLKFPRFKK